MTETTQPEIEHDPTVTECRSCGGPVRRRRPSMSGAHFCQQPECQRAKQRFHYRRRRDGVSAGQLAELAELSEAVAKDTMSAFVQAALEDDRVDCGTCARPAVVPGWAHPNPEWDAACSALMARELPSGVGWLMKAVYPS